MKINKKILMPSFLGFAVLFGALGASQVLAYQGDYTQKGPNYSEERHVLMTSAFQNRDYSAWKELMAGKGGRVNQVVNQENFAKFTEAHDLAMQGKREEANKIRQELGLRAGGQKAGSGYGQGKGQGSGRYSR
ncbi:hypothetical protein GYA54_02605 [Candidatus Kuenenbacteria bacterium]|nr:hypothetical protein [Candidatus Kuenenbacteria bacterium]